MRDALKKNSRGLCRGAAGNPRVPRLLPGLVIQHGNIRDDAGIRASDILEIRRVFDHREIRPDRHLQSQPDHARNHLINHFPGSPGSLLNGARDLAQIAGLSIIKKRKRLD